MDSVGCDCYHAPECAEHLCQDLLGSDNCLCSGNDTDIALDDRPLVSTLLTLVRKVLVIFQIVYLTFDDAFTATAERDFYQEMFDGSYKNPNGCVIRATHFVAHQGTDYSLVNRYWHLGHEIAAHSVR